MEIERRLDFAETYRQLSGPRFVEASLAPLTPILGSYGRVLRRLGAWNGELLRLGEIDEPSAREFGAVLGNHEGKLQALEANVKFLLSRVSSTIQMVRTCPL